MRRQHVLRTSSAQRLCIFCACRLGIEPVPSQLTPFVSTAARRGIRTTSSTFQSAAPAAASTSDVADATTFKASQVNAGSSLTPAEQEEKAPRLVIQRDRDSNAQQSRRRHPGQKTRHKSSREAPRSTVFGKHMNGIPSEPEPEPSRQEQVSLESAGLSLGEAMRGGTQALQRPQKRSNNARQTNRTIQFKNRSRQQDESKGRYAQDHTQAPSRSSVKHIRLQRSRQQGEAKTEAKDRFAHEQAPQKTTHSVLKRENPFGAPSVADNAYVGSGPASGWGMGATATIDQEPVIAPERREIMWDDGVERPANPNIQTVEPPPSTVSSTFEAFPQQEVHGPEPQDSNAMENSALPDRILDDQQQSSAGFGVPQSQPIFSRLLEAEPVQYQSNADKVPVSEHLAEPTQPYEHSAENQAANTGSFGYYEDAVSAEDNYDGDLGPVHSKVDTQSDQQPQQAFDVHQTPVTPGQIVNDQTSSLASATSTSNILDDLENERTQLQRDLDQGDITQKGYEKRAAVISQLEQLQRDFDEGDVTQKGYDKKRAAILAGQGQQILAQSSRQQSPLQALAESTKSQDSPGHAQPASASGPKPHDEPDVRRQQRSQGAARPEPAGQRGDLRYRAVPFDPSELQQRQDSIGQDQNKNWAHLRRKASEPSTQHLTSSESPFQQAEQRSRRDDFWDPTKIEESFRQHQQTRSQPSLADRPYDPLFDAPQPEQRVRPQRCARCGGEGHRAMDCPNRDKNITCFNCGQVGHRIGNCPQPRKDSRRSSDEGQRRQGDNERRATDRADRRQGGKITHPFDDSASGPVRFTFNDAEAPAAVFSKKGAREVDIDSADRNDVPQTRFATSQPEDPEEDTRRADRASRRAQKWAVDEDDVPEVQKFVDRRKERRNSRREFDEREDDDEGARDEYRARKAQRQAEDDAKQRKRERDRERRLQEKRAEKAEQGTPITLPEYVSVQQLSQLLGVRYEEFVERLEDLGYDDIFAGKTLNAETSGMIAMEYNFEPNYDVSAQEEEQRDLKARPEVEDKDFLPARPPVVTIMGHVDHGKTTILDYLRKSSVAAGEAGGITQHIGAFSVPMSSSGKTITFLDTPGHAAFLAMRQRGANVTDIVILVVAADDSVKPQTLEAIKHAKAAGVPMIVAINKVDKEEADIQRCKQDLARHGVEIEDFGGDTQVVCVSGKTGQGMDDLEETVVTLSEILDHRAEVDGEVEGWVLEATTKLNGRVATVLVRRGTLRPGSVIVAGKTWARVKTLKNEGGKVVHEVGPGMPVEVDGWKDQPMAGDEVLQAPNEQKATSVVEFRREREDREKTAEDIKAINEARLTAKEKHEKERAEKAAVAASKRAAYAAAKEGIEVDPLAKSTVTAEQQQTGQMIVPFIIKADVSGSAEAVSAYIQSVSNPLIAPQILHSGVGAIHESDIELADAAEGHIISFNLATDPDMNALAQQKGVKVLENNIIYRVLDDVKAVLEDKLPPIISQRVLGEAEVSAAFEIGVGGRKKIKIAGCKVRNGVIGRGTRVRVTRNGDKVYDGKIDSLKNVKKDVQEMRKGTECGMGFDGWENFEVGDQIQTFEEISEKRKL